MAYLQDKAGTPYTVSQADLFLGPRSLARRARFGIAVTERDLPVSPIYVNRLRSAGFQVQKVSKWLNAVVVEGDSAAVVDSLVQMPFVVQIGQLTKAVPNQHQGHLGCPSGIANTGESTTATVEDYGIGLNQAHMLGIDSMHARGFTGSGVLVAVMDNGFTGALEHVAFRALADSGRLTDSHDFAYGQGANVFHSGTHGGSTLSCAGGYYPGNFIGGAFQAEYALYITEANQERPIEMFNWVAAAERADSLGVDLISTSLGYSVFDKPWLSFTPEQMDGQTAFITRAVNMAAEAGILCVTSAGNEGGNPAWQGKITAPADAQFGLTVGAVFPDSNLVVFSGRGLGNSPYPKPDVVAQGVSCLFYDPVNPMGVLAGNGTSFSAPLVSGLIAGMMEQYPNLRPVDWIHALHVTSDRAAVPDTNYGYGIPNYNRLNAYLATYTGLAGPSRMLVFPNPQRVGQDVRFFLNDKESIKRLEVINAVGQRIRVQDRALSGGMYGFGTQGMASGTYLIRVETSKGYKWGRLVLS